MAHTYFVIKEPGEPDRVLVWDTRTLSIGRSPENDLVVEDEEVSRKHALLKNERGAMEIGDYRTGNGTFVNGERVQQTARIKSGDVIALGKLQLELRHGDEHPAKLGIKLTYASHLKTVGSIPQMADAGSTMIGMMDDTQQADEPFVIQPDRSREDRPSCWAARPKAICRWKRPKRTQTTSPSTSARTPAVRCSTSTPNSI